MDEIQQAKLLDDLVERIRRWGAADLVSTLLVGIRPLAFVGGQLLWLAQPALGLLVDRQRIADYARLLEQPETLDWLQVRLEEGQT